MNFSYNSIQYKITRITENKELITGIPVNFYMLTVLLVYILLPYL